MRHSAFFLAVAVSLAMLLPSTRAHASRLSVDDCANTIPTLNAAADQAELDKNVTQALYLEVLDSGVEFDKRNPEWRGEYALILVKKNEADKAGYQYVVIFKDTTKSCEAKGVYLVSRP